ncbi:MAG TPA: hypothetical protein VHC18_08095 [Amycolatopsis sp.]|nr:hypothetical protein [Amycolatopsis sp.]
MKTSTVLVILIGVLLSFASVATAAGYLWSQDGGTRPAQSRALPTVWPSQDGHALRAVPISAGEMVTALPADTGAHVLCQALSQQRWEALLGGPALRESLAGGCHVVTAALDVTLHLDGTPAVLQDPSTVEVAGHSGELEYLSPKINARLNLRLTDAAPTPQIRPFLRVAVSGTAQQPLDDLTASIAEAVVHATMAPGPALPKVATDGTIPAQRMAPVPQHGIVDSPWPVISWQLCTALTDELGGSGKPKIDGQCTVRGVHAASSDAVSPRAYPDTIAGRPALVTDDLVAIKLTDDSAQELTLTGGRSLRPLAEAVLPSLLGR